MAPSHTDGADNMAGAKSECPARIRKVYTQSSLLLLHESRFKLSCLKIMQATRNAGYDGH